jgi:photosystem II stability/assembly factor-like uncharacterized protein
MTVSLSPNGSRPYQGQAPVDHVLVATIDGVARLERKGTSWEVGDRQLQGNHISSILFEPVRQGLFAGVHGEGLYYSADGGRSWEPRMNGLTVKHVFSLASTQRNGSVVLYAGTEPAHLFESTDYGETWTELPALRQVPELDKWTFPAEPHTGHVKAFAFDPRDENTFFVAVEQGALLKTTDAGRSFRELAGYAKPEDRAYKDVHRILLRPGNPNDMYMTNGNGSYSSHDAGESWDQVTDRTYRIGYPDQLLASPVDNTVFFMAGSAGSPGSWRQSHHANSTIVRSKDAGRTWEPAANGLPDDMRANVEAMNLATYPGGFSLFAATTDGEVFISDDAAQSWQRIASGLPPISKVGHYMPLQAGVA